MDKATVLVSYRRCERDAAVLDRLEAFFATLKKEGLISVWSDRGIEGGERWREEIDAALARTRIAVLLISQNFYTSDFICDVELPRLLAREARGSATILPVFVSPADEQFEIRFEDENGVTQRVRLAEIQGGVAHPSRTLLAMREEEQERHFQALNKRIRTLVARSGERPVTAPVADVRQPTAAPRRALVPPLPTSDRYALTLELARSANTLTVHYWLRGRQIAPLVRSQSEVRGVLQAGGPAQGDALFTLLFGDDTRWEPLFRAVFGYPEHGPRPNPTRGGVRLRICCDDPLLLAQPWARLSWAGRRLLDDRWEITTGSDIAPVRDCVTVPAGDFLIIVPTGSDSHPDGGQPGAPMAALVDELWPSTKGASPAARVVERAAEVDAALQGMRPHGVYLRAALAAAADSAALLLDGTDGPAVYPLSRLVFSLRDMDPPPSVLILDLADPASPEIPARLALELGERIPLVLWRRRGSESKGADQLLLAGLRRWLGGGEDPVAALHAVLREADPATIAAGDGELSIHADYRSWQTSTATRSRADPLPRLALDRDMQKALVTRHVGELVRSSLVRIIAVIAYGSRENLLSELTGQLHYELDLTAADWAAIEWHCLGLPDDRSDLRRRLGAHMAEVLNAVPDEPLHQLLRRKGPRGMRPGIRGVLWLDWGVLDDSGPARAWPEYGELSDWLAFCSEELATHCPNELRVVCFLAVELPEDKFEGLAGWFEDFRGESWYLLDRFRFLALNPLGRVDPDHLRDYLASIDTGLDQLNRADLVRLIRQETAGAFDATVRLLDEGRTGTWIALLQRLRAGHGKDEPKRRNRAL